MKDTSVGVRKRVLKLLKDVYLRDETGHDLKITVASAIIERLFDEDNHVQV
jgi:hypothetical protein